MITLVMIILSVAILYLVTPWMKIMLRIWCWFGKHIFQYTVVHDDSTNGDIYALTFTNDDFWQQKMLQDLQKPVIMIDESEGK